MVATKQKDHSRVYRASAANLQSAGVVTMTLAQEIDFDKASGGDIFPTGREIAIRQEQFARLYLRDSGQNIEDALNSHPVNIPVADEPNGEAVTFDQFGDGYFTTSEGVNEPMYFLQGSAMMARQPTLRCYRLDPRGRPWTTAQIRTSLGATKDLMIPLGRLVIPHWAMETVMKRRS